MFSKAVHNYRMFIIFDYGLQNVQNLNLYHSPACFPLFFVSHFIIVRYLKRCALLSVLFSFEMLEFPVKSGIVNATFTVCFEIFLSSFLFLYSLKILEDLYDSHKLEQGHLLNLNGIARRRKKMEILFVIASGLCFILIELGINGTSRDKYEKGLAIEVNRIATDSSLNISASTLRTPLKRYSLDSISTDRGLECISIDKRSTELQGRANISRLRMIVRKQVISNVFSYIFNSSFEGFVPFSERACGGKMFTFTWNQTSHKHNCTDLDFNTMRRSAEYVPFQRRNEALFIGKVLLPPCLNITSEFPFYFSNLERFMMSTSNFSSEAVLLRIFDNISILKLIRFEDHDNMFDYGAEVALSSIERKDGYHFHIISQVVNSVYDTLSGTSPNPKEKFFEVLVLGKGNYTVGEESLVIGQKQVTTLSRIALTLTLLLCLSSTIVVAVLFLVKTKVQQYDLSNRGTIASIVNNSFKAEEEINDYQAIHISINQKPEFDHLSIHNSLVLTGRRIEYQLKGVQNNKTLFC